MTLTELRYIIAVAREHHFGRAAESCHVSQPTLSVAIKKLEEELRVAIFERGSSEVTLTPIGERIVLQAQQTLEAADSIKHMALYGKNQLAAPLRIGAIQALEALPGVVRSARDHQIGVRGFMFEFPCLDQMRQGKCGQLRALLQ